MVGADGEDSCATGIGGDETDNLCVGIQTFSAGAAYVFNNLLDSTILDLIDDLIETVNSLGFSRGVENSLINKLEAAFDAVIEDNDSSAIANLNDFITTVEKFRGKKISPEDADELTALAQDILALLDPEPVGGGTGTVKGTVRNSAGARVGGILVTTDPPSNSDTTNNGGKYNIGNVPTGPTSMIADCSPDDQIEFVTVFAGATATVDFIDCDL